MEEFANRAMKRAQLRSKHRPEFTKSFCSARAKTKRQKKEIQYKAIRDRLIAAGEWEDRKWYYGDHAIELREYIAETLNKNKKL
jgi:hypothetical protein